MLAGNATEPAKLGPWEVPRCPSRAKRRPWHPAGVKGAREAGAAGMVLRRRQGPGRCREEEQRQWDPQEGREAWWPEGTGASRQGREQENREPGVLEACWTYSAHLDTPSEPMTGVEAGMAQDIEVRLP